MQADTSMKGGYLERKTPLRAKKGLKRGYMRAKPKQGRKAAIAEADRLLQEAVVGRKRMCQVCGEKWASEGHHIIRRGCYVFRWRAEYVIDVCHECHERDGEPEFNQACIQWLGGQEAYEALRLEGNTGTSEEPGDAIRRMSENTDSV